MKKIFSLALFFLLSAASLFAEDSLNPVVVDGDELSYLPQKGEMVAKGNVKMIYKDTELLCDQAIYNSKTNLAVLSGKVQVVKEGTTILGENIIYDFNAQTMKMSDVRLESAPMYGKGVEVNKVDEKYVLTQGGYISTCDLDAPHYRLVAKKITIYPKQKIISNHLLLYVGKIPIFYFPFYVHSLKDNSFPLEISPGRKSEWGPYCLTRYRYYFDEDNKGKILADWYQKRGLGLGLAHKTTTESWGNALLNLYYIEDELYKISNRDALFKQYHNRQDLADKYLEDDRYRLEFSYNHHPTPNLTIVSEIHEFSDEFIMRDFFKRQYDKEPHPLSYMLVDYGFTRSSLSLFTQKRLNRFYQETEYLPQLKYDFYRQKLGETPLYLKSITTLDNVTRKFAYLDRDDDAMRFHSDNVVSLPKRLGWIFVNPFAGGYTTYYSKNYEGDENINRFAFHGGGDISTNFYKILDINLNILGYKIDKMRHILTPKWTYEYIHAPTVADAHLPDFDEIDQLDREEKITFTLGNKLQVKSDKRKWDFLYFSPAVEYFINKEVEGSYFYRVTSDLEIYPVPGVAFNYETKYDCRDRALTNANAEISFFDNTSENSKYDVSFGHRYLRGDSSQTTWGFSYWLNPKLKLHNYLIYEYKRDKFVQQQYMITRDLHCWWMDFGLDIDRNQEFTFWVMFRLKGFDDLHLGFEQSFDGARRTY